MAQFDNDESLMTPLTLEILLHCHSVRKPFLRAAAPACREAMYALIGVGVIIRRPAKGEDCEESALSDHTAISETELQNSEFTTTARGAAWLERILQTPMPRLAWVDDVGNVILVEGA